MSSPSTTPFEWLSGGLLSFGKKTIADHSSSSQNSSQDVSGKLQEIYDSLQQLAAQHGQEDTTANHRIPVNVNVNVNANVSTVPEDNNNNNSNSNNNNSNSNIHTTSAEEETETETLAFHISRIRLWLYEERMSSSSSSSAAGDPTALPNLTTSPPPNQNPPTVAVAVVETLTSTLPDMVPLWLHHFPQLPFESRKDVASILQYLFICGLEGSDAPIYEHVMTNFVIWVNHHFDQVMDPLLRLHSYSSTPDIALHGGSILRSLLKHLLIYETLVTSPLHVQTYMYPFLDIFVHSPNFDMSTDATETLKMLMTGGLRSSGLSPPNGTTTNPTNNNGGSPEESPLIQQQLRMQQLAAECLLHHYEDIFDQRFNPKLLDYHTTTTNTTTSSSSSPQTSSSPTSSTVETTTTTTTTPTPPPTNNYMIRRMALQILSTVLLTRSFYQVMIMYIGNRSNLMLVMNLLRDSSPHITLDAFHVFKIFVANPAKPPEIEKILKSNQRKLCTYLETLHQDRESQDVQFRDEKALVIATLQNL